MPETITKRVGKGSFLPMSDANVQKVIELLNLVPSDLGGPAAPLEPSIKRDALERAICDFQAYQFGQVTGFLDPDNVTIRRLEMYASGARPGPDAISVQFKAARQQIVKCAKTMVGKVSNRQIDPKTHERQGWRELWEIFDSAGIPVESESEYESRRRLPTFKLPADHKLPFDRFKDARHATPGLAWCGIFATWALNQAGFNCKWVVNKGIRYQNGSPIVVTGPLGITVGDICVVNDKGIDMQEAAGELGVHMVEQYLSHHIIIASHPAADGTIDVIEGNYPHLELGGHSIVDDATRMPQGKRNIRQIIHRYSLFQPVAL